MVETVTRFASNPANKLTPLSTFAASAAPGLIRGGGEILDLTRARVGLESLDSYSVITTLLLNVSLSLFLSTPKKLDDNRPSYENWAKIIFAIAVSMSVVFGGYSVLVFSLIGLYAKRALGFGKDEAFLQFIAATQGTRVGGFNSFLASLLLLKTSFILSVFINYEGKLRWWLAGLIIALDLIGWWKWSTIYVAARELVFN